MDEFEKWVRELTADEEDYEVVGRFLLVYKEDGTVTEYEFESYRDYERVRSCYY